MGTERILILGGGVAGLATAWWLSRRGAPDVVLVERERALALHSSRKNAAILRTATDDPEIEALARHGAEFLRDPPAEFGDHPLADRCGILIAVAEHGADLLAWERRAYDDGRAREIDAATVAPHFTVPGMRCAWFADEGRIEIDALLAGFERGARRGGVRFEIGAGPSELLLQSKAVVGARLGDGREIRAEKTMIAAGGWAARLATAAGSRVELRPTRRHLVVTENDPRIDPRGPVVWVENDSFYARPEAGGLLLCACDEVDADPDSVAVVPAERELALSKGARWLPRHLPAPVARCWSGIRTLTRDGRFVIGADRDVPGLFWAAGLGGHGMVCGPAVGEIAAAALLD